MASQFYNLRRSVSISQINYQKLSRKQQLEHIISISQKEIFKRNQNEINLMKAYCQNFSFFQKYDEVTLNLIMQAITTQKCVKNEIFIRINSYGDQFYIILQGHVNICVNDNIMKEEVFEDTADIIEDLKTYCEEQKLKVVNRMNEGQGLGELAIKDRKKRGATVIAGCDLVLAIMDRKNYLQILQNLEDIQIKYMMELLLEIYFFNLIDFKLLKFVSQVVVVRDKLMQWKQKVYDIGDRTNNMYIIESGEFTLYYKQQESNQIDDDMYDTQKLQSQNCNRRLIKNDRAFMSQCVILTKNQFFGEEEIIQQIDKRTHSVKCTSQYGRLFKINKEAFFKYLYSQDSIKKYFNKIYLQKNSNRNYFQSFDANAKKLNSISQKSDLEQINMYKKLSSQINQYSQQYQNSKKSKSKQEQEQGQAQKQEQVQVKKKFDQMKFIQYQNTILTDRVQSKFINTQDGDNEFNMLSQRRSCLNQFIESDLQKNIERLQLKQAKLDSINQSQRFSKKLNSHIQVKNDSQSKLFEDRKKTRNNCDFVENSIFNSKIQSFVKDKSSQSVFNSINQSILMNESDIKTNQYLMRNTFSDRFNLTNYQKKKQQFQSNMRQSFGQNLIKKSFQIQQCNQSATNIFKKRQSIKGPQEPKTSINIVQNNQQ